jgi:hypothetical protein
MSKAAACVNAVSTGELTRFSNQPARTSPSPTCSRPDSSASHTARLTHSALPGCARPVSDAVTSKQVNAVGPTDSRTEPPHSAATRVGSSEAYTPVTSGMPAKAA